MLPIIFVIFLVIVDQVVKYLALTKLAPIGTLTLIENVFGLAYVENRGAAFGIMQGSLPFLSVITTIIIIMLIIYYIRLGNTMEDRLIRIPMLLIIGGAIGNLIDRVFRTFVVDMFQFKFIDFPVFNMADIYVVCGCFAILLFTLFMPKREFIENSKDELNDEFLEKSTEDFNEELEEKNE